MQVGGRRIAALETRLANYHWTNVQNRDPVKTYNPMTLPEKQKLTPGFDWLAFFEGMGAPVQRLDVNQPSFIKGIGQLVKTVPVSDWRVYLKFQLLDQYAPRSRRSSPISNSDFITRPSTAIQNTAALAPRGGFHGWQLGEIVGRMFVESHFGADAKARMLELVGNLLKAFDTRSTVWNG